MSDTRNEEVSKKGDAMRLRISGASLAHLWHISGAPQRVSSSMRIPGSIRAKNTSGSIMAEHRLSRAEGSWMVGQRRQRPRRRCPPERRSSSFPGSRCCRLTGLASLEGRRMAQKGSWTAERRSSGSPTSIDAGRKVDAGGAGGPHGRAKAAWLREVS